MFLAHLLECQLHALNQEEPTLEPFSFLEFVEQK